MKLFDRLERKLGRFAIRNLMLYLIALYVIGYIINMTNPMFYIQYLCLDASKVLKGEIWRLFTYLCYPPADNLLMMLLMCYFYFLLGRLLERIQGTFRFNVYIFVGIFGQWLAAILIVRKVRSHNS